MAYQLSMAQVPLPVSVPQSDLGSVNSRIASMCMQRLIFAEMQRVGFQSAQPAAIRRLEIEVTAFVQRLYQFAHEYANLANRAGPITKDLLLACAEAKLEHKALFRLALKSERKKKKKHGAPTLLPPPSRSSSPKLLGSDDEDAMPIIPLTLRNLPSHFPTLPPKHTYMRTPASPAKKRALPSLEKKLKTQALVQDSLKNLLLATEENENQEDGELLGHIVNWEATTYPKKRWKV